MRRIRVLKNPEGRMQFRVDVPGVVLNNLLTPLEEPHTDGTAYVFEPYNEKALVLFQGLKRMASGGSGHLRHFYVKETVLTAVVNSSYDIDKAISEVLQLIIDTFGLKVVEIEKSSQTGFLLSCGTANWNNGVLLCETDSYDIRSDYYRECTEETRKFFRSLKRLATGDVTQKKCIASFCLYARQLEVKTNLPYTIDIVLPMVLELAAAAFGDTLVEVVY